MCYWMIIQEVFLQSATNIFALIKVIQILQALSLYARKYIVYEKFITLKLLKIDELGSDVIINMLDSVLNSAGGVCTIVWH